MLSRRHLRVKVLQSVYAYYQSGNNDLHQGEKQLLLSINKLYELFIWQCSFLIEATRYAENRIEDNKKKHFPTKDDLNPNRRFVEHSILNTLADNIQFRKLENLYKINWGEEQEIIRKFYYFLRELPEYERFMNAEDHGFDNEKRFLIQIIEKYFAELELLQSFYDERSIYFVDDYHLVSYLLIKFFKSLDADFNTLTPLPTIYKTANEADNEDLNFVKQLFRWTVLNSDEYGKLIASTTANWEQDRIAVMDMLILKMALAELFAFPSIPIKVTMNEYIDISKYFSTPRSKIFVNGVLDKLIQQLKAEGKIIKTGRGLLEN
ncbi:MAG: transcription antitermination factor NusB [Bacteroidales bacterium]|jgi:N utilization substance protein B|nr:transcription antitermination factor NusB [Bacteroidales bacterium]